MESLSGFRLGVALGAPHIIERMKLQAIVSLRAPGYCQAVLQPWFAEPVGWLAERIAQHQAIRDDLLAVFRAVNGMVVRMPEAGSYLLPRLPQLSVPLIEFVRRLRVEAIVTVTPGTEFSPHTTDSIRLNFSQNHQCAWQAAERIAAMTGGYRDRPWGRTSHQHHDRFPNLFPRQATFRRTPPARCRSAAARCARTGFRAGCSFRLKPSICRGRGVRISSRLRESFDAPAGKPNTCMQTLFDFTEKSLQSAPAPYMPEKDDHPTSHHWYPPLFFGRSQTDE